MICQEKLYSKKECTDIIKYSGTYTDTDNYFKGNHFILEQNKINFLNNPTSYKVFVIPRNSKTDWMFSKILTWFKSINQIPKGFIEDVTSCTLHRYSVGDEFTLHVDVNTSCPDRVYNLGIQLNSDYTGGEYICIDKTDNEVILNKETGTAVGYSCNVPHKINKITRGERWSIVMPINITKGARRQTSTVL